MTSEVVRAPNCDSPTGAHGPMQDAPSPAWTECQACGERFYLVSESVLEKLGIATMPREPRGSN